MTDEEGIQKGEQEDAKPFIPEGKLITGRLLCSVLLASLGSFNFGYNIGAVNTPGATFSNCVADSSRWACFTVDWEAWGVVAGILPAGALLGSLAAGSMVARMGRKKTVLATNLFYISGLLLLAFSMNYIMLLVGRLLVGVGVGMACIAVPIYLTEMAAITARGFLGSFHQLAIVTGLMVAELLGFSGLSGPYLWRVMFALGLVPCVCQIIFLTIIGPESPRYLAQHQQFGPAKASLILLRGHYYREEEFEDLVQNAAAKEATEAKAISLPALFLTHRNQAWRSLLVASVLHLGQQFCGINSVLFFSAALFPTSHTVPLLIGLLILLVTILAITIIDRAGRRPLTLISSGIMLICTLAITAAFMFNSLSGSVIAILGFVGSFALGLGPIPWLMINEIFPTIAVSSAVSFAVCLNWIANMLTTVSFPLLRAALGNLVFIPYAVVLGLFFLFSLFFLPETRGRPVGYIRADE